MKQLIEIQNLKCGGCKAQIEKELVKIEGVIEAFVDEITSEVTVDMKGEVTLNEVLDRLRTMGYPKVDESNSVLQKTKSYVSCMIGRTVKGRKTLSTQSEN